MEYNQPYGGIFRMANNEQLAILEQGAEVWNEWRHDNPDVLIDLEGAVLRHKHLEGINLSQANMKNANLSFSNLKKANPAFCRLKNTILSFTTLGFGDIIPKTSTAAMWVTLEVIFGYVMLGGLITIFASKLSRRGG
jgi:hypothetical protein